MNNFHEVIFSRFGFTKIHRKIKFSLRELSTIICSHLGVLVAMPQNTTNWESICFVLLLFLRVLLTIGNWY